MSFIRYWWKSAHFVGLARSIGRRSKAVVMIRKSAVVTAVRCKQHCFGNWDALERVITLFGNHSHSVSVISLAEQVTGNKDDFKASELVSRSNYN